MARCYIYVYRVKNNTSDLISYCGCKNPPLNELLLSLAFFANSLIELYFLIVLNKWELYPKINLQLCKKKKKNTYLKYPMCQINKGLPASVVQWLSINS